MNSHCDFECGLLKQNSTFLLSHNISFQINLNASLGFAEDMELVCSVQEYAWGKQGSSSQVARYVPQLNRFLPLLVSRYVPYIFNNSKLGNQNKHCSNPNLTNPYLDSNILQVCPKGLPTILC